MATVFDELGQISPKFGEQNKRISKYLKNHKGKVSKEHHKKLVAKMKANHNAADPVDPSTGAKIRDVNREARGATQSKYSTAWKNLQDQTSGQENALGKLPDYYDQRFDHMTTLGVRQANAAAAIQQGLAQQQAASEKQTQGFRDTIAAEAGANPLMASSNQAAQDSSAARTASAASQGANIAAIGNLSAQETAGQAQNIRKEQGERTEEYKGRIAKLKTDAGELAKEIGGDFIAQKSSILSGIGDRQVKAAAVAASAADKAADNALDKGKLNETKRHNKAGEKIGETNAETGRIRANKSGTGTASKPMKPSVNNGKIGSIIAAKNTYLEYSNLGYKGSQLAAKVTEKAKVNPSSTQAKVAHFIAFPPADPAKRKKMRSDLVKLLHSEGYTIKGTDLDAFL
jgi:hypothetical protein